MLEGQGLGFSRFSPRHFQPYCVSLCEMLPITRRFFTTATVQQTEKATAEVAAKLQKEFSEHCAAVMKMRGHKKFAMNTVKEKNGHSMTYDFSYGWPCRYYCKCNLSTEKVSKEAMLAFEVGVWRGFEGVEGEPACRRRAQTLRVHLEGILRGQPRRFQGAVHRRQATGQDGGREEPALHARNEGDLLHHPLHVVSRLDLFVLRVCLMRSLLGEEPPASSSRGALPPLCVEGRQDGG